MLPVFFLLIIVISFLLVFAPMVDHVFYLDHKIEESTDLEVFIIILVHIILVGVLIYLFHFYIVRKYIKFFKLNETYIKIIDLILGLTLVGLQRNLVYKLRYLSNRHPIRAELII
jgi:hypothetical protein|tara:strand:- start:2400 stop:2744 length:345 start_codon:yes stop_codon:yes gene_type:complete